MPKKKWTAGKVALGAAGCVVVGLSALCMVMALAVALTPEQVAQPSSPAPEPLVEPRDGIDIGREREHAERFAVPDCDDMTVVDLYRDEHLGRAEGPGMAFFRGPILSMGPPLIVARDGAHADPVWVEAESGCIASGLEQGTAIVVSGGWLGRRVEIVDGERVVYPKAHANAIVTAEWWDEKRAEWLEWAREDEIPPIHPSDRRGSASPQP